MEHKFEVRVYRDDDDKVQRLMIVEVSKIDSKDILARIINFLERLREG